MIGIVSLFAATICAPSTFPRGGGVSEGFTEGLTVGNPEFPVGKLTGMTASAFVQIQPTLKAVTVNAATTSTSAPISRARPFASPAGRKTTPYPSASGTTCLEPRRPTLLVLCVGPLGPSLDPLGVSGPAPRALSSTLGPLSASPGPSARPPPCALCAKYDGCPPVAATCGPQAPGGPYPPPGPGCGPPAGPCRGWPPCTPATGACPGPYP